ncbi:MAG TPA: D-erythronate dehydrogenase [Alphaproteobacteria bacterium]
MQVVITGGAGMLGKKLAKKLLERGTLAGPDGTPTKIERLILLDVAEAPDIPKDPRVSFVAGEVSDTSLMRRLIAGDTGSVFHFAAVVSAGAEADFDLGYRVNLDGTRAVLEACRALPRPPRVVFTSSIAVYGGDLPEVITDEQKLTPQTSYGAQKAMGELLVADYTRKGFIDGRSLRLPTIVVRPGKPNKAASTFASSIIREPLQGQEAICPVRPDNWMPLLSPRKTVEAFIRAHDLPSEAWGWNRSLMLPSLDATVGEMAEAVKRVAGADAYKRIVWRPDALIQKIVDGWPKRLDSRRARAMGFEADPSLDAIIQAFIEDDLQPAA